MKLTDLNIVALDANAKTAALFSGTIDAVSGDAPAFDAYVRATNQQPETMMLSEYGVPLIGFGFAANNAYLAKNPEVVQKFLAATKRGFAEAARDYKAACELMQAKVHLAGTVERCVDYNKGVLAFSTPPTDANWGQQTSEEWTKLIGTLKEAGELFGDKPLATYYTNDVAPKSASARKRRALRRHRRGRRPQRPGRGGLSRPRRPAHPGDRRQSQARRTGGDAGVHAGLLPRPSPTRRGRSSPRSSRTSSSSAMA